MTGTALPRVLTLRGFATLSCRKESRDGSDRSQNFILRVKGKSLRGSGLVTPLFYGPQDPHARLRR
jgi:hypothetical protein